LGGLVPHPALVRAVEGAAHDCSAELQLQALIGVITDAAFLPMASADGIAAVDVGIPVRYSHSPIETAQLSDLSATIQVLHALMARVGSLDLARGSGSLD
jgi:putative aminopeptidase FrvX